MVPQVLKGAEVLFQPWRWSDW